MDSDGQEHHRGCGRGLADIRGVARVSDSVPRPRQETQPQGPVAIIIPDATMKLLVTWITGVPEDVTNWTGTIHSSSARHAMDHYDLTFDLRDWELRSDMRQHQYTPSEHTGLDNVVQNCVVNSPDFGAVIIEITDMLDREDLDAIETMLVYCDHGVHRSVAIVELLGRIFLTRANICHHTPRVRRALDASASST